ncbi:MAG: response regulator transcription factor [Gammaproteobacteria bacterium]
MNEIPLGPLLLVDDDRDFSEVLARALTRRGFDVHSALDPEEAVRLAERYGPRYAVIDLCIGNASGLVMLERLMVLDQRIRAVVLTGYASVATAVEAIKLGAIHYLTKPTDADEIVAALHRNHDGDSGLAIDKRPLSVRRLEWEHLQKVLVECNGNISAAARRLRMHRRTLQRKLQKRPVKD